MNKILRYIWIFLWAGVLFVVVGFVAIYNGWVGYMPAVDELENPVNRYATQIYSDDGQLMGTWSMSKDNRVFVSYDELPSSLIDALVATEDVRFYDHSGIDLRAFSRAIVKRGLLGNANAGGGSTITQQLAKQLYSEHAKSTFERMIQKTVEWVIAIKLERFYTKEELLTMYLNYFDFLNNAVGIRTASQVYFGKLPKELTVVESAMLVGMCKNPSLYNPLRFPERSKDRRNTVLGQMRKAGYLSNEDCAEYQDQDIVLNFHRADHKEGIAPYLREYLRKIMMAKKPERKDYASWQGVNYYEDSIAWEKDPLYGWCNKNRKKTGETYNIYTDGLKIYTSIDSRMQRYAEEACFEHVAKVLQPAFFKEKQGRSTAPFTRNLTQAEVDKIMNRNIRQSDRWRNMVAAGYSEEDILKSFNTKQKMSVFSYKGEIDTLMTPMDSIRYYKHFLRTGFMSMDPKNGQVKAYVGGLDFSHFTYDMAGVGRRQVGSTIKPYLYSLAMESGFTPCDQVLNVQRTYGNWTPRNSGSSRVGELVTLQWGLQQSNNWISAYLMDHLTPPALVEMLHRYGIRTNDIEPYMPLCLGTCDIKVSEMVSAYTAFANHGIRVAPMYVTRIEDNEGNVVAEFQPQMEEVISEDSAFKMIYMMRTVIDGGTGSRVRSRYNITSDMGGKTGTTNSNSDCWFMGYTPSLVSGVWVGGEERDIHFDTMTMGQGAAAALPVWALYMQKVYGDKSLGYSMSERFDIPSDWTPCATASEFSDPLEGVDQIFQ